MASSTGTPVLASLCSTSSSAPRVVGSVAGQYLHGGDQLGVGVHHNRRLVSVEPFTAALAAMAHLRVMRRHHAVPAHPVLEIYSVISALHILEQQLPQQFRLAALQALATQNLDLDDLSLVVRVLYHIARGQ